MSTSGWLCSPLNLANEWLVADIWEVAQVGIGGEWTLVAVCTISSVLVENSIMPILELQSQLQFPTTQISSLWLNQLQAAGYHFHSGWGFFFFFSNGFNSSGSISVYDKWNPSLTPALIHTWQSWVIDVGSAIPVEEEERLWSESMFNLQSAFQRLIRFKVILRAYVSPSKLNSWKPRRSGQCTKCLARSGNSDWSTMVLPQVVFVLEIGYKCFNSGLRASISYEPQMCYVLKFTLMR